MNTSTTGRPTPLELRRRWKQVRTVSAALRVTLLASYTVDPLIPYLGVGLHDAGLPADITVGPLNQMAQQCLDDRSEAARSGADVLVVCPRFEELGEGDALAALTELAGITLAAAERWNACLLFVLPALPDTPRLGVGDHAATAGPPAAAVAAREAVRARLAGVPNVVLADAEAAVRSVGGQRAHHPSLFRYASIPYTEEVFVELADQLAALLKVRHGGVCRAVVLDADALLLDPAAGTGAAREGAEVLRAPVAALRRLGVRVAVRGSGDVTTVWPAVQATLGDLWPAMVDDWAIDDRPPTEQVRDLTDSLGIPGEHLVLLGIGSAPSLGDRHPVRVLDLGDDVDRWPAALAAGGVFDRAPVVFGRPMEPSADHSAAGPAAGAARLSLEEYVANLEVDIAWRSVDAGSAPAIAEMLLRTKDFTLGIAHTEAELAERMAAGCEVFVASVEDRLGSYGDGVALALDHRDGVCVVDLFLVSCPVLGKGVEEAALERIVRSATEHRCRELGFRLTETGRNALALGFLDRAAAGCALPLRVVGATVPADR